MKNAKKLLHSTMDVARIVRAGRHSIAGLRAAAHKEAAFRQELILFTVLAPLAIWFGRNGLERALLFGSLLLVLVVELLNSAIEAIVDRVGREEHELSGRAKDMGSAAVSVSLLLVTAVWALILWDHLA